MFRFLSGEVTDINFEKKLIISNQEAIKRAVIENVGVSIMSKLSVEIEVKAGLISTLEIEDYDLSRDINLVYDKRKHITPAGNAFFDILDLD